ncbi:MAG: PLP-dependent aminotransferase family protein [Acidimicrobiia bacterium]|nr:PLP-dependent aminotransferase family protein [Acidimicrobiia bacterium]
MARRRSTPLIRLSRDDNEPLYRQLRNGLVAAIEAGTLGPGDLLPSSRTLALELDVSRNTANLALQELVTEGFIQSIDRVGYVVSQEVGPFVQARREPPGIPIDWDVRFRHPTDPYPHMRKPPNWSDYSYPFVVGQPDPSLFPTRAWNRAGRAALDGENRSISLSDLIDQDDQLLTTLLCERILPARGISATPDQILVSLGSQQGLFLVAHALVGSSSRVGVEDPGYPDARHIFSRRRGTLRAMPIDDQGILVEGTTSGLDVVFVTPSHQYPTNVTLAVGRRQQLLTAAADDDFVVIEDDYDAEFRYQGQPTPALKAMDETGRVVYLGSFSKFLAPGLRLGYIVADAPLIEHLRDIRRYMLRHPAGILQRTTALMIESGDYAASVRKTRIAVKDKWERASSGLATHLPEWNIPTQTGGLSIWVPGPSGFDATGLARLALGRGIVIEPGNVCFLNEPRPVNYFKLGFSGIAADSIEPGIAALATLIEDQT